MPKADLWIFIFRNEHNKDNYLTNLISENFKNYINISLDYNTEGQASTCLLAKKYLDESDIITVGSCDAKYIIDKKKYFKIYDKYDAAIFTTQENRYSLINPKQFGWVKVKKNNIIDIKCKQTISKNLRDDCSIIDLWF